jgi:hypothetical protein
MKLLGSMPHSLAILFNEMPEPLLKVRVRLAN